MPFNKLERMIFELQDRADDLEGKKPISYWVKERKDLEDNEIANYLNINVEI
jgi:hypothetical protein